MAPSAARKTLPKSPELHLSFIDYAWNRFDAVQALSMLLTPSISFFGQHEIMFAALGAWIVAPDNCNLRKAAIIRSIRSKLVQIERVGTSRLTKNLEIADVVGRLMHPQISAFYENVYYPIGGLKTLTGAHSHPNFSKYYHAAARGVETAVEIAEIYHYHATFLEESQEYRQVSLNAAAPLINVLGKGVKRAGGNAVDNVKKQWRSNRSSIAFAYAAMSMSFKSGEKYTDLLHVAASGGRAFRKPSDIIRNLIGRALFVENSILSKSFKNERESIDFDAFSGIQEMSFGPPLFDEIARAQIDRAFAKRSRGRMAVST